MVIINFFFLIVRVNDSQIGIYCPQRLIEQHKISVVGQILNENDFRNKWWLFLYVSLVVRQMKIENGVIGANGQLRVENGFWLFVKLVS